MINFVESADTRYSGRLGIELLEVPQDPDILTEAPPYFQTRVYCDLPATYRITAWDTSRGVPLMANEIAPQWSYLRGGGDAKGDFKFNPDLLFERV